MAIAVIKAGMYDTFQDEGRYGYAHWGINPTGVMDSFASRVANLLVGNEATATLLEMTFPAAQLEFTKDSLICICGADFTPQINTTILPCWQPIWVPKGSILRFTGKKWGAWTYMAIQGGFQSDHWLQSGSTHVKIQMGGYKGRRLQQGDHLIEAGPQKYIPPPSAQVKILPFGFGGIKDVYQNNISFLPGTAWDLLTPIQKKQFENNECSVDVKSDRMGYYLTEFKFELMLKNELISKGVNQGTIQLLPSGQPVVLMADHQTTGGYPIVGNVIHSSLPSLSQISPGKLFHFTKVDQQFAESIYISREERLIRFKNMVHFKLLELCAR
jgi:antagonist of KipI